jgi:hypothetical protein
MFFILKCIKIIFFLFFKIIFKIKTIKKNIKKIILNKNKFNFLKKHGFARFSKRTHPHPV